MYTGHRRILTKVSNDFLTDLADQGNTWVTIFYNFFCSFEENHKECVSLKVLGAFNFSHCVVYFVGDKCRAVSRDKSNNKVKRLHNVSRPFKFIPKNTDKITNDP